MALDNAWDKGWTIIRVVLISGTKNGTMLLLSHPLSSLLSRSSEESSDLPSSSRYKRGQQDPKSHDLPTLAFGQLVSYLDYSLLLNVGTRLYVYGVPYLHVNRSRQLLGLGLQAMVEQSGLNTGVADGVAILEV